MRSQYIRSSCAEMNGVKRTFLITVDHFSDFFEVNLLKDLTPESVISACKQNFSRFGVPLRALTDNGTSFASRKMVNFSKQWDFELVSSAPHHQQANGKAEAAVKIAKHLMKKADESGSDFWYALLHWRNIPNKIGSSPAARLLSRSTRCGVPTAATNLLPRVVEDVPAKIEENRKRSKLQYDRKTRKLPELEVGSPVYAQVHPESTKLWTPGMITHRYNDRSYLVNVNGADYRRSLVHLKPRKDPDSPSSRNPSCPPEVNVSGATTQEESTQVSPSKQKDADIESSSSPTVVPSPGEMSTTADAAAESGGVRPITPTKIDRPKRTTRIPEKLKDFNLHF